jgi:hypothetical protein
MEWLHAWDEIPKSKRPTAAVVGSGPATWRTIEQFYALRRVRVGHNPGGFGLCGQASETTPLLFGVADAFLNLDVSSLGRIIGTEFLLPILSGGTPANTIVRLLPPLRPMPSLGITSVP